MGYVATQPLPWGEDTIPAGASVPADEPGRDYAALLYLGQIREVDDIVGLSDDAVRAELKKVTAERDELKGRVDQLEADDEIPTVEVPDGVVPGETPGWPLVVFPLPDDVRALLAEADVSGAVTIDELRETVDLLREAAADGGGGEEGVDGAGQGGGEGDGQQPAPAQTAENDAADVLPDGVTKARGGWYLLPDGSKVRGREALDEALAKLAKG